MQGSIATRESASLFPWFVTPTGRVYSLGHHPRFRVDVRSSEGEYRVRRFSFVWSISSAAPFRFSCGVAEAIDASAVRGGERWVLEWPDSGVPFATPFPSVIAGAAGQTYTIEGEVLGPEHHHDLSRLVLAELYPHPRVYLQEVRADRKYLRHESFRKRGATIPKGWGE